VRVRVAVARGAVGWRENVGTVALPRVGGAGVERGKAQARLAGGMKDVGRLMNVGMPLLLLLLSPCHPSCSDRGAAGFSRLSCAVLTILYSWFPSVSFLLLAWKRPRAKELLE